MLDVIDGRYTDAMKILPVLALVLSGLLPVHGFAQWQWVDKDGRKVFSDRPPPSDIPAKNIVKQPGAKAAPAAASTPDTAAAAPASAPRPGASAPVLKLTGKDKELDDKKKQAEADEADKRKQDELRVAQLKVENCMRARKAKTSLDSGIRIARTNDKGEREFLDDAGRAAEAPKRGIPPGIEVDLLVVAGAAERTAVLLDANLHHRAGDRERQADARLAHE